MCREGCTNQYYNNVITCAEANNCGERVFGKEIESFEYSITASWAEIGVDPLANPTDQLVFDSDEIECSMISIPAWQPGNPWPGIYNEHNTCFQFVITIYYADDTACILTYVLFNIVG